MKALSDEEIEEMIAPWVEFSLQNRATEKRYLRCNICGFIIDPSFKAIRPAIEWSTAGRGKGR